MHLANGRRSVIGHRAAVVDGRVARPGCKFRQVVFIGMRVVLVGLGQIEEEREAKIQ